MMISYIDRFTGAVYTEKEKMFKAWKDNYDGGDSTNCAIWQDNYIAVKVYSNGKMSIIAPPHMHGNIIDDLTCLEYLEKRKLFHED